MHFRFKLRAAAVVTVAMIALQVGSVANAGGVLTHPPDKTYCAVQDNACGILYLYSTSKGTSHAHAVTRVAESGHPENIKVVLNWEDRHTGF